jgi:SPP1 gp7 family putative phage head morphogenesis protein
VSSELPFNVPFDEASAFFADKMAMSPEEFAALEDWAKLRAFTVATVTKAEILQDLLDAVQVAIDNGLTLADFRSALDDIMETRGWEGITPWHAETVFRTNIQSAYGAGRLSQQRAAAVDFPFLMYVTVRDDRVREEHAALDGVVRAINDPFWSVYYPPWDYNCRCDAEALSTEEADATGPGPEVGDMEDSGFSSPGAGYDYAPDLSELDPDLRRSVQDDISAFDPSKIDD